LQKDNLKKILLLKQESESILSYIDKFEDEFNKRVLNVQRQSVIKEISEIIQEINKQESTNVSIFERAQDKEWVIPYVRMKNPNNTNLQRPLFDRNSQRLFEAMQPDLRKTGEIYIPIELFRSIIQELIVSIQEGKLDNKLRLFTEQIIYDALWEATEPKPK
jgi:hypothetical protein